VNAAARTSASASKTSGLTAGGRSRRTQTVPRPRTVASRSPPALQAIYYLNPMALAITAFRWAMLGTPNAPLEGWIAGTAMAFFLLASGYLFFRRREGTFADVI